VGQDHDIEADAAAVEATPAARRDQAIELFLARYNALWLRIARRYSRSNGIRQCDIDDAAQAIRLEAYKLLSEGAPEGVSWIQALWRRSEEAVRELATSGATTGFAGMVGHERRRRGLEKLRNEQQLSSDQELLAAWNARARQNRSDPERQGAIATEDDLVDHRIVPNGSSAWDVSYNYEDPGIEQLFSSNITGEMIELVVGACAKEPGIAGDVAEAWLTGTVEGAPMSCAEIARRIGTHRATVQRTMPRVREIAREVITDYLVRA
jgi:hypothetical protein